MSNNKQVNGEEIAAKQLGGLFKIILFILSCFVIISAIKYFIGATSYNHYTVKAYVLEAEKVAEEVAEIVESYFLANKHWPSSVNEVLESVQQNVEKQYIKSVTVDKGVIRVKPIKVSDLEGYIIYIPSEKEEEITWSCKESTIESTYLPYDCRK